AASGRRADAARARRAHRRAPAGGDGGRARERSCWPTGSGGIGAAQRASSARAPGVVMTRSPILPFLPFPIFPEEASTLAGRTDHLLFFLLGLSGFMTAIIAFLILWFGIRYRRRPDNERATQVHGSYRLEIAWSVVPL